MKAGFLKDINSDKVLPITLADFIIDKNGETLQEILTGLEGYSHVWIGPTEPDSVNTLWIDTSSDGLVDDDEDDIHVINNLVNQMMQMQNTISTLKKQIEWLMSNGVKPEGPNPEIEQDDVLLFEDGAIILLENDEKLLLESIIKDDKENTLLFDNGLNALLENGKNILLEL